MPQSILDELSRLGSIGDLIGSVAAFSNLPSVNNAGLTGLVTSQIQSYDLILVQDASADSHGNNALYEATTTTQAGAAVTWVFLMNFDITIPAQKTRQFSATTDVPTVVGETGYTVSDDVNTAYTTDPDMVEVYVNGIIEPGFTISSKKLALTGYPTTGWTSDDKVDIYYYGIPSAG
jgi:hypothetical protein